MELAWGGSVINASSRSAILTAVSTGGRTTSTCLLPPSQAAERASCWVSGHRLAGGRARNARVLGKKIPPRPQHPPPLWPDRGVNESSGQIRFAGTAPLHHCTTAPLHHCTTAPQHHSTTAPLPHLKIHMLKEILC